MKKYNPQPADPETFKRIKACLNKALTFHKNYYLIDSLARVDTILTNNLLSIGVYSYKDSENYAINIPEKNAKKMHDDELIAVLLHELGHIHINNNNLFQKSLLHSKTVRLIILLLFSAIFAPFILTADIINAIFVGLLSYIFLCWGDMWEENSIRRLNHQKEFFCDLVAAHGGYKNGLKSFLIKEIGAENMNVKYNKHPTLKNRLRNINNVT